MLVSYLSVLDELRGMNIVKKEDPVKPWDCDKYYGICSSTAPLERE